MRLTDIMSGSGLAVYAEIALLLFVAAFLGIAIWIYLPRRKREHDQASRLPLEGDPDDLPPPPPPQPRT
jgi:cbb3-type cytochrome oxidase subunit 3